MYHSKNFFELGICESRSDRILRKGFDGFEGVIVVVGRGCLDVLTMLTIASVFVPVSRGTGMDGSRMFNIFLYQIYNGFGNWRIILKISFKKQLISFEE